jgi:monoamine oxidase
MLSWTSPRGDVVDLGAQWIGPTQDRVSALAREFGLHVFPQYSTGAKVLSLGGKISRFTGAIPKLSIFSLLALDRMVRKLDAMVAQVPLDAPYTAKRAAEWDGITVEGWKRTAVRTRAARSVLDVSVRAIFAAEPAELSFLYFLFYLRSGGGLVNLTQIDGGAQQTRLAEGTQALCVRLAAGLGDRVILNAPVNAILQQEDAGSVRSAAGVYRARRMIVAIPPTLAARIAYDPPLPPGCDQLMQRMPMGSVVKCVAFYEHPFWRDDGFSGEAIADTGPVTVTFDDSPEDGGSGALVAFLLGDQAKRWGARPAAERKAAVLDALARFFGPEAREAMAFVELDWVSETWSRGGYAALLPPGVLTSCGATLRAPAGRIHWAGAETARAWNGYMDGAIESGERAADEVLALLG